MNCNTTHYRANSSSVPGDPTIQASATGYSPTSTNQEVTAPRFTLVGPTSMRATQAPATLYVYAADAFGTAHFANDDLVVTLTSSDPGVAFIDSATVTILANTQVSSAATVRPVSPGGIQLAATDARSDPWRYADGTSTLSVTVPNLNLNWSSPVDLGIGQWVDQNVSVPDTRTSPLIVTLNHASANSFTADTITVNTASSSRAFRITGLSAGVDTIRVTAPVYNADLAPVLVGLGRVDGLISWPTTLSTDSVQVTLRTKSPDGTVRAVAANTTFNLAVDANLQFWSGGANSAQITSVTVPADGSQVAFWLKRTASVTGPANVSITSANYTAYNAVVTVNAP